VLVIFYFERVGKSPLLGVSSVEIYRRASHENSKKIQQQKAAAIKHPIDLPVVSPIAHDEERRTKSTVLYNQPYLYEKTPPN